MNLRPYASVIAAPPIVALLGWGLWAHRFERPELAYWADTIAVVAAFVVGAVAGEGTRARSVGEALLRRVEHGGLAVLASSVCIFAFANARLETSLGAPFFAKHQTGLLFAAAFSGAVGGCLVGAALRHGLVALGRVGLAVAAIVTVAATALATKGVAPTRLPVDALDAALTSETPPIEVPRRANRFKVDGSTYDYVAFGDSCAIVTAQLARLIEPVQVEDRFAHCPPLDVRRTPDGTAAAFAPDDKGERRFLGEFKAGLFLPALKLRGAQDDSIGKYDVAETISMFDLPAMKAPSTSMVRSHRANAFEVAQDGSRFDSCLVNVLWNARDLVSEGIPAQRTADPIVVCPRVETRLVPRLDLVSVQVGFDTPKVSLEGRPITTKDVAAQVRAPDAYRPAALGGVALAFGAIATGMMAMRSRGRMQGFRTAHYDGAGVARLDDGRRLHVGLRPTLRAGLIALRGVIPERPEPSYRDAAEPMKVNVEVLPASVAELERRHHDVVRAGGRAAIAIALAGSVLSIIAWIALAHL